MSDNRKSSKTLLMSHGVDLRPETVRVAIRVRGRMPRWACGCGVLFAAAVFVAVTARGELEAATRAGVAYENSVAAHDRVERRVADLVETLTPDVEAVEFVNRVRDGDIAFDRVVAIARAAADVPAVTVESLRVVDAAAADLWQTLDATQDEAENTPAGQARSGRGVDRVSLVASTPDGRAVDRFADAVRIRLPAGRIDVQTDGPVALDGPLRHRFRLEWAAAAEERP
ncbi:MAG: hypothetical protein AAGJ97_15410 [Planctomycetota bacterium]